VTLEEAAARVVVEATAAVGAISISLALARLPAINSALPRGKAIVLLDDIAVVIKTLHTANSVVAVFDLPAGVEVDGRGFNRNAGG
jgi:hypothetical protein